MARSDTEFVTREELETVVAAAIIACGKALLPNVPNHIHDTALWLEFLGSSINDPAVAEAISGTVELLRESRPGH
jgi:hypothetical protein